MIYAYKTVPSHGLFLCFRFASVWMGTALLLSHYSYYFYSKFLKGEGL